MVLAPSNMDESMGILANIQNLSHNDRNLTQYSTPRERLGSLDPKDAGEKMEHIERHAVTCLDPTS